MSKLVELYKLLKKESDTLFDGAHNVHTPKEVVDCIISDIDTNNKSILVMYNPEFVLGLVLAGVDPKQITFYSDHVNKVKLMNRFNVQCIDMLESNMKFDIIVGNPPYQDSEADSIKLWNQICNKSVDLLAEDGYIGMVTPQTVISGTDALIKANKPTYVLQKWLQEHNFIKYSDEADKYFNVGVPISYWIAQNKVSSENTIFHINNEIVNKRYVAGEKVVLSLKDSIIDSVINSSHEKYQRVRTIFGGQGYEVSDTKTDNFKNEVIWNSSKNKVKFSKCQINSNLKLAMNNYKKFEVTDDNFIITNKDVAPSYFSIEGSKENLEKLRNLLTKTKLFRYVGNNFLNSKGVFLFVQRQSVIPKLDLSVKWTDEMLYKEFKLTKEQIEEVEAYND